MARDTDRPSYWNHNTAYHPWVLRIAERHRGDVLDVGCGDGLLAARLAPVSRSVIGLEPDPPAAQRARRRLDGLAGVVVVETPFEDFDPGSQRFDLVTFVASVHHLDLRRSLLKACDLLRPSGEIAVVGLAANRTVRDWLWAAACLPAARVGGWIHHETPDVGVIVAEPREGLAEIRAIAADVLPGASVQRRMYYRYLLRWQG